MTQGTIVHYSVGAQRIHAGSFASLWDNALTPGYGANTTHLHSLPHGSHRPPQSMRVLKPHASMYVLLVVYEEDPMGINVILLNSANLREPTATYTLPAPADVLLVAATALDSQTISIVYVLASTDGTAQRPSNRRSSESQQGLHIATFTLGDGSSLWPQTLRHALHVEDAKSLCYGPHLVPCSFHFPTLATTSLPASHAINYTTHLGSRVQLLHTDAQTQLLVYHIPMPNDVAFRRAPVAGGFAYCMATLRRNHDQLFGFDESCTGTESAKCCSIMRHPTTGQPLPCHTISNLVITHRSPSTVAVACATSTGLFTCLRPASNASASFNCIPHPQVPQPVMHVTLSSLPERRGSWLLAATANGSIWVQHCSLALEQNSGVQCQPLQQPWARTEVQHYILQSVSRVEMPKNSTFLFVFEQLEISTGAVQTRLAVADVTQQGDVLVSGYSCVAPMQLRSTFVPVRSPGESSEPSLEMVYADNPPWLVRYTWVGGSRPLGMVTQSGNLMDRVPVLIEGLVGGYGDLEVGRRYGFDGLGSAQIHRDDYPGLSAEAVTPGMMWWSRERSG